MGDVRIRISAVILPYLCEKEAKILGTFYPNKRQAHSLPFVVLLFLAGNLTTKAQHLRRSAVSHQEFKVFRLKTL
jgi:hypothetical protein